MFTCRSMGERLATYRVLEKLLMGGTCSAALWVPLLLILCTVTPPPLHNQNWQVQTCKDLSASSHSYIIFRIAMANHAQRTTVCKTSSDSCFRKLRLTTSERTKNRGAQNDVTVAKYSPPCKSLSAELRH